MSKPAADSPAVRAALDERRSRILCAAGRLLGHYGLRKTTVADIARAAGVGVGSVYLVFDSKEAIVGALTRDRFEHVLAAMTAAAAASTEHGERIRAVLDARTRAFGALEHGGHHARELLHFYCPSVEASWRRFREDERALLGEVLRPGRRPGPSRPATLPPGPPRCCAPTPRSRHLTSTSSRRRLVSRR